MSRPAAVAVRPAPAGPVARLSRLAQGRGSLGGACRSALARHEGAPADALAAWAEAALVLANVNAGPGALLALFRMTALARPGAEGLGRLAAAALGAADVCRGAGAGPARACLDVRPGLAARRFGAAADEAAWWRALGRLAREAPGGVAALAAASDRIVAACGAENVEGFVAAGIRAVGRAPARQDAFFRLEDPEARRVLDRLSGQPGFTALKPRLAGFAAALWGASFPLREAPLPRDEARPRRAAVSSGIVLVPDFPKAAGPGPAARLYEAAVAHATAHLALGGPPFAPGTLKPVQLALVGLVEDARIEALAMRRFPGLRGLWAPFHTAEPSPLKTAPMILARLARGLFDPLHADPDGIVEKGRALFAAEPDLGDPGLSRRIGGLLGHDVGQMRIRFDEKRHVVEPAYRDDNLGLWLLPPPPPDAALQDVDVAVRSARAERRPDAGPDDPERSEPDEGEGTGRARAVAPDARGIAVARYPEWDRAAGLERPDWVTVRDVEPACGAASWVDEALAQDAGLRRRVERLVRHARIGRPTRLRRQPDGLDLDLDAAIDAAMAIRAGELPEDRVHIRRVLRARDLAVTVLVDTSESTRDRVPAAGTSIIAVEKLAVAVLAQAMGALGDRFALRAFASNGRDEVGVVRVKDFDRAFDEEAKARLAGLEPGHSTRLGAALRHAGAELDGLGATRRIVIALTDGAPSDVDVADPAELVEDARRAVLGLYARGIDVFGITLDPSGQGAGAAVFGRSNHMPVRRIEELPNRLSDLYFRVARR